MSCKWIEKVGLAAFEGERLLVVRKRGGSVFILPGGKPEGSEGDLATLVREVNEELGCGVVDARLMGVFTDRAAGIENAVVIVRLYHADLVGAPKPQAEIDELAWLDIAKPGPLPLAPSIINGILPYLRRHLRREKDHSRKIEEQPIQGLLELI